MFDAEPYWVALYTADGAERDVQIEIEKRNIGTLLPTFSTTWIWSGRMRAEESPVIGRYVMAALPCAAAVDQLSDIDGAEYVLGGRVTEKEICRLTLAHVMGDFNRIRVRSASGRFSSSSATLRKSSRKPRASKRARMRSRTHSTGSLAA